MAERYGVIGGGIVGLAMAYKLQQLKPGCKIILFEKEKQLGQHQSGHNSGVLHCGLYYQPGSLKAKLAVEGIAEMTAFCATQKIDFDVCGKVVVASNATEEGYLDNLAERGKANGLAGLKFFSKAELAQREPFVAATKALLVPQEGIVSYPQVMQALSKLIQEKGGEILLGTRIDSIREQGKELILSNGIGEWQVDNVLSCAGLQSDRVFKNLTHQAAPLRIIPFRGEYMELKPEAYKLVNHLVYPVPDPKYPFLGVHFTRMINGGRELGPNAVFATKREGYSVRDVNLRDTLESLSYKGFINFMKDNFLFSMGEFASSLSRSAFIKKAQKLVPDISADDLLSTGTAGVRAQAMDASGKLLMDFNIVREGRQVHVLNAPSPGATASLAIAEHVVREYCG